MFLVMVNNSMYIVNLYDGVISAINHVIYFKVTYFKSYPAYFIENAFCPNIFTQVTNETNV